MSCTNRLLVHLINNSALRGNSLYVHALSDSAVVVTVNSRTGTCGMYLDIVHHT